MPTGVQNGKYYTPEEIEAAWERYLRWCDNYTIEEVSAGKVLTVNRPQVPTIGHFCHQELKMTKEALLNYEKAKGYEAYFGTIKRIKDEVYEAKQRALNNGQGSVTGLIFDLKCNYGWQDKQVIDTNVNFKATFGTAIIPTPPEAGSDT